MIDEILQKDFISRDEAKGYLKTPEGRRAFAVWVHREKCARAIARLLIEFNLPLPEKTEQERLTKLLFQWTSPATPVWEVMAELGHAEKLLQRFAESGCVGPFVLQPEEDERAGHA